MKERLMKLRDHWIACADAERTNAENILRFGRDCDTEARQHARAKARADALDQCAAELIVIIECPECGGAGGFNVGADDHDDEGWHWCGTCDMGREKRAR